MFLQDNTVAALFLKDISDTALQKDLIFVFPEMKLRGLVHNFYILVSVSDLYIPTIGPQTQDSKKIGRPIMRIYKSLIDTWM